MEGRFLSMPAKRPFDMPDTIPSSSNPYANGAPKRRPKPLPPPIVVSASDTAFRLLCPSSKIGGVIGKSGAVVNLIRQETGTKIRVEDLVPDCDERVVLIVGSHFATKKIALKAGGGEEREVSPAQEALSRVFDRVLEVDEEEGGAPGSVQCRLLVPVGQVGCVMGKGGKVIERIRKESGAKIKVLNGEQLPDCASPSDEVVQIMGEALAVKKALLSVSKCLQENPPSDKGQAVVTKPVGTGLRGSISDAHGSFPDSHGSFPDTHGDHFLHRSSFLSPPHGSSLDYVSRGHPLPAAVKKISISDQNTQEVTFRLLCPNDKVGGVIGKGGAIINALENETGASISVGSTIPESEERLITISAMENPESRFSPAQNAIARVFARIIEAGFEKGAKGLDSGSSKGALVTARLLVASNQIGCLMGKGGSIVAEMRKTTGAGIRILGGDKVPKCASDNDQVVQITGEFGIVQDALFLATSRLHNNMLPTKTINSAGAGNYHSTIPDSVSYGRTREPTSPVSYSSLGLSHMLDRPSTLAHSMDHLGLSHNIDRPPSPGLWSSQAVGIGNSRNITDIGRGLTSLKGCVELGSGSKSAIVTNTTVDIVVPEHVMGAVYGENGSNLSRIRQISGAKVVVHDPRPGLREGMVVISGTPDQTQAAQSLLQAFILSAGSPDSHSRLL